jgi:hypothetical protein
VRPRSKYRNVPTVVDGTRFHSKREAARWSELRLLERAGKVAALERQVAYPVVMNGVKVCSWLADFRYREAGETVVEDVKGCKTPLYRLKKKLVEAQYGITIRET